MAFVGRLQPRSTMLVALALGVAAGEMFVQGIHMPSVKPFQVRGNAQGFAPALLLHEKRAGDQAAELPAAHKGVFPADRS
jgi:hypothetical protein